MSTPLRVMVDMSATLLHHGHVRLLRAASELGGTVVVALTTCEEIVAKKGYQPELDFEARRELRERRHNFNRVLDEVPAPSCV